MPSWAYSNPPTCLSAGLGERKHIAVEKEGSEKPDVFPWKPQISSFKILNVLTSSSRSCIPNSTTHILKSAHWKHILAGLIVYRCSNLGANIVMQKFLLNSQLVLKQGMKQMNSAILWSILSQRSSYGWHSPPLHPCLWGQSYAVPEPSRV